MEDDAPLATRASSGKVLDAIAGRLPDLIGGSADLSGSNKTLLEDSPDFSRETPEGRNLRWGVREHGMASISNGLALHGGVRPYAATFFIFTDYARPAIRLAALMKLPVIYVLTHDSIGVGGDGPTHQPVEHLASFRAMPGVVVLRPADANEVAAAWRVAIRRREGPTLLVLTRQKVPHLPGTASAAPEGVARGGYALADEAEPDVVLLATGSEVQLAMGARDRLDAEGISARVVSFPSWELFRALPREARDALLPAGVPRVSIEAGATLGWHEWVGHRGVAIGIDRFGRSAEGAENFRDYGLTAEAVTASARTLLDRPR